MSRLPILFTFATVWAIAAASNLTFLNPPDESAYTIQNNSFFLIQWTSNYSYTDLNIFAGPFDDGSYTYDNLARYVPQGFTSFNWTAAPVNGADLEYDLHLEASNAQDHDCVGCITNSAVFRVSQNGITYAMPAASSVATAPANGSMTAISSPTARLTTAPEGENHVGLGLGVGLGVGIPLLLGAGGLFYFLRRRKSVHRSLPMVQEQKSLEVMNYSSQTPVSRTEDSPRHMSPQEMEGEGVTSELGLGAAKLQGLEERWELDAEQNS